MGVQWVLPDLIETKEAKLCLGPVFNLIVEKSFHFKGMPVVFLSMFYVIISHTQIHGLHL